MTAIIELLPALGPRLTASSTANLAPPRSVQPAQLIAETFALGVPRNYARARKLKRTYEPKRLTLIGFDIYQRPQWLIPSAAVAWQQMLDAAISKNISVIVAQDTQNILIFASKVKVYQVFINLITNAIDSFEHAPEREKKSISISVTSEAGQIVVVVNDNGSGIPKENLNRLFVRSFTTKKTGLGIGLMHTQQLVQKDLLGKIKVRSEIGVGTEFKIYISKKFLISR